ncbi:protein kinase C delta type [Xenopus laevis]|uniref:Protein kinase C delta type n=1 Tax=Xenopus laevis TaxID=8355 RepID=A0A8J0VG10_XENLA|nr:protein kinase C delta type [Xenopus laevis]
MAKQNIFGSRTITGQAGTLDYMAPEILSNKGYNAAVDWWACGVIICEMATGEIPFPDDSDDEDFSDEPNIPSWLSKDLKDLLRKLLERNPDRRLGVYGNIRQHPFFSAIDWEELEWPPVPSPFDLETSSREQMKPYEGKALSFLESQKNNNASGDTMNIPGLSFIDSTWQD